MRTATQDIYGNPNQMTFGVQMLLIANIAASFVDWYVFPLEPLFQLTARWWEHFGIWELFTYQFLHQGFMHLLFNMLGLFFLGSEIERTLGTNRFFSLYFLSGILAGLGWSLLSPANGPPCIGASGSVFGVLGAYAALYPNRELYLYGMIPIRAWVLIVVLGSYELLMTINLGSGSKVANSAHLFGGLFGYIYAVVIGRPDILNKIKRKLGPKEKPPVSRAEIDRILDKAAQRGIHSLTRTEREQLKRAGGSK